MQDIHSQQAAPSSKHICHLSVLNPCIHSRIFYKLALSQIKLGYRVSIIGQDNATDVYWKDQVQIIPVKSFHRLSYKRFTFSFWVAKKAKALAADVYVVHSPELLPLAAWLKRKLGCKIIYDVHEDYAANIRHATHYPVWLRKPLAYLVRKLELRYRERLDAVSYAEILYDNILQVDHNRKVILRNTFSTMAIDEAATLQLPPQPYLLYTGTLHAAWGIFDTLQLWEKLRSIRPMRLVVAGFTHDADLIRSIHQWVADRRLGDSFQLIGGQTYVAYADIVYLITNCWALCGLYRLSPNLQGKIPTKFYEAMACQRPLIFTDDPFWNELNDRLQLGIAYDVKDSETTDIIERIDAWYASGIQHDPKEYLWETDAERMGEMLEKLRT